MKVTLKLARIGMNMQEGTIAEWFKQPGDAFAAGEPLYAVETDKVTQEVEASAAGTLLEILVPAGEEIEVGTSLCVVDVTI